jgi:hypothetical protein
MTDPIDVALLVSAALEQLGVPHTVGGSLASSFAGEPRSTIDIDIVVAVQEAEVERLVSKLASTFDIDALRYAIHRRSTANLIHQPTQLKVDLFIAGGTPLDHQQIARRKAVELSDGRRLYIHRQRTSCCRSCCGTGRVERCRSSVARRPGDRPSARRAARQTLPRIECLRDRCLGLAPTRAHRRVTATCARDQAA